jgi:rhamnosyltransferase
MPLVTTDQRPAISIVIPTRNGMPGLRRLLDAVFAQETEKTFEVFAMDSGSDDGSLEVLREYPLRLIEIGQAEFDWGRMRERLFEEARGDVVVNLSQDAIPARPDWLDNLIRPLEDRTVGASSGSSIPDPDREFPQFQWEKNGYYYFTREIKKFTARYGRGMSFGNTAVPKRVWQELHINPQATGEDFGFQMKLHAAGCRIAFPEDAPVLHHHFYTLKGVFRRCRNEGLALREMGVRYNEADLLRDLASPRKYIQWLREVKRGSLRNSAEWLYPVLRPVAVYAGSRFAREMVWY